MPTSVKCPVCLQLEEGKGGVLQIRLFCLSETLVCILFGQLEENMPWIARSGLVSYWKCSPSI